MAMRRQGQYHDGLGGDRLSALPDKVLVRVLSHLPTDEAARASALSRRWPRVVSAVPVVDLVDPASTNRREEGAPVCLRSLVTNAILSKDPATLIRTLRLLALDYPASFLGQWIGAAASCGAEEVDVELRYPDASRRTLCPFVVGSENGSADFDAGDADRYSETPRQLFRCGTLRRLRLVNWTLALPSAFGGVAASLDTLCLKRIMAADDAIQRLLSGCPRLADLTLEECPGARDITVPSNWLRSFAMVCCHNAGRVVLLTRRLRSLRYEAASFLHVDDLEHVAAVTIDVCEDLTGKSPKEVTPLTELVSRCKNLRYLHLALPPSMAYNCSAFMDVASGLPEIRQLVLKGFMAADHAVLPVAALLVNTRNLEVLSLFPEPTEKKTHHSYGGGDEKCAAAEEAVDYERMTQNLWRMNIPCLGQSLRRISIEKYSGNAFDRTLAQFLMFKAAVLEEFSVTLSAQLSPHKEEIAMEFRSWLYNPSATIICE